MNWCCVWGCIIRSIEYLELHWPIEVRAGLVSDGPVRLATERPRFVSAWSRMDL